MDLDTLLTTLYVWIDDWYKRDMADQMRRHAGPELKMSDSEVLTLAIVAQWRVGVPWQSERGLVRYIHQHGKQWFPQMLKSSQFNQRVRDLWAVLVRLQQIVADILIVDDAYEVVDCVPLPHCSLSQAASHDRHWLSGQLGHGGTNGGWFYGEQLLVSVSQRGVITGWLSGLAAIDDRWIMEAFVSTRNSYMRLVEPPMTDKKQYKLRKIATPESFSPAIAIGVDRNLPYLADEGFNGQRWQKHWQSEYQVTVITAPPKNAQISWPRDLKRWLSHYRQIVETTFACLSDVFGLKRLNAHSDWGKITRIAAKTAAYNFGIMCNRILGRPDGAIATLII